MVSHVFFTFSTSFGRWFAEIAYSCLKWFTDDETILCDAKDFRYRCAYLAWLLTLAVLAFAQIGLLKMHSSLEKRHEEIETGTKAG
jgi:hypothetical protein